MTSSAKRFCVYGAAGYTGRLITAELVHRQQQVVVSGRDGGALEDVAAENNGAVAVQACSIDDRPALVRLLADCDAVINCAGPFAVGGEPVVEAAIQAGCHYTDISAEQRFLRQLFERHRQAASDAAVAVVPAAGFYYAVSDMLASAVASQFTEAPETITVTYAIDNWLMTPGSWLTVQEFLKPSQVFAEGEWRRAPLMVRSSVFDFGRSRGRQRVLAYPGGEIVTVPRHTGARKVAVQMTASTFASPAAARILPAPIVVGSLAARAALRIARRRLTGRLPDRVHKAERAGSSFEIVVEATDGDGARRATAQGSDIYGISAITSANLAMTLADGIADSGVLSPAQAVDAPSFLAQLRFDGFSCQL